MTLGFEVLVQEVMAAMTTSPWPRSKFVPSTLWRSAIVSPCLNSLVIAAMNPALASVKTTRSCGRLGPASEGATSPRLSSRVSVKTGSGVSRVR